MPLPNFTARLEYVHPWPNAAGVYIARHERLLLDQGIDFEITFGGYDRGDPVELLARGEADLAVVPPNRLLSARAKGRRVVGVAAINQRPLEAVITTAASGITRPRDLVGKRIGLLPSPRLETFLKVIVEADGGDPDGVELVYTAGYEGDIRTVISGEFDAVINILAWEPLLGGLPPEERIVLPFSEWGGPSYHSYTWAVREDTIERNPELVTKIVKALAQGYNAALAEPERAVAALQPNLLNVHPSILRESLALVSPTWTKPGFRWGEFDLDLLTQYASWLADRRLIPTADTLAGAVVNDFIAEAYRS